MKRSSLSGLTVMALGFALLSMPAVAGAETVHARLTGFQEVPAVSTAASGEFRAKIGKGGVINFELSYEGLESNVLMSHIHLGQPGVNGGISVWLCTTPAAPLTAPPGTQICPQSGTVTGMFDAAGVVGPLNQGIGPEELDELIEAIRAGVTYVNVHSVTFPGGEIRGLIR
jgi:hypothetical protein